VQLLQSPDDDAILDYTERMTSTLAPGDLFLFLFAGHGYEFHGRHLLLCPKARLSDLDYFRHTVPVDLLKRRSARSGVARGFILDACRSNLRRGRDSVVEGLRGAQVLRDVVAGPLEGQGPLTVLCACDEGCQAQEVAARGQGLFSLALLGELEQAVQEARELWLDERLREALRERMQQLARTHGLPADQRPWIQSNAEGPLLLAGRLANEVPTPKVSAEPLQLSRVKCPVCGTRNEPDDTFECVHCRRDYLCRRHFVEADDRCQDCAEKLAQERLRRELEGRPGQSRWVDLGGGVKLELVWIPPGEFMMGSTKEERAWAAGPEGQGGKTEWFSDEGEAPRRTRIAHGFWMGRTETTMGQWKRFVAETSYLSDAEKDGHAWCFDWDKKEWNWVKGKSWRDPNYGFPVRDEHPVACISWNDAVAFCGWLTETAQPARRLPTGWEYRLPAEAEWEYACRGGRAGTKFWWGDSVAEGQGRLNAASDDKLGYKLPDSTWPAKFPWSDGYAWVSPVDAFGAKGRNGFGLADMLGNVWEWCLDSYDAKSAHEEVYRGDTTYRVLRGGSFFDVPGGVRCASRDGGPPSGAYAYFGFRVVLGVVR
jgi:formylglycine-generating enzyme required for sulfatase activity